MSADTRCEDHSLNAAKNREHDGFWPGWTPPKSSRQHDVVIVQIYGITDADDMRAVADLELDHVGIVLDEGFGTWDGVDLATAKEIIGAVPTTTTIVALSLHTEPNRIAATVEALKPAIVHLGRAEAMTSKTLASLRTSFAPVHIMATVPIRDATAITEATRLADQSDYLLLDTAHPTTGVVGATGCVHDWTLSKQVVEAVTIPVVLAGGLGPANVAEAVNAVRPSGVDSETHTSREDDRRRKDPKKVRQFVEAARAQPPS
jgi:phosphoribosylanthranilate isomerase